MNSSVTWPASGIPLKERLRRRISPQKAQSYFFPEEFPRAQAGVPRQRIAHFIVDLDEGVLQIRVHPQSQTGAQEFYAPTNAWLRHCRCENFPECIKARKHGAVAKRKS